MAVAVVDKAREQRSQLIANSLASGRMEGLEPSAGAMVIFERFIDGELTMEQMRIAIDEYADLEDGPVRLPEYDRS